MPQVIGFELVMTEEREPEGCGAGWDRLAVLATGRGTDDDALRSFAGALEVAGWEPYVCGPPLRCFDSPDEAYFLAAITPAGIDELDAEGPFAGGFPKPIGEDPQILVSVEHFAP